MFGGARILSVVGMENLWNTANAVAQYSAVAFGVLVFIAITLATVSSWRRHRREQKTPPIA